MMIKRGEIVLANLELVKGSEQGKTRPVLIIQRDSMNLSSPTIIIVPITSKIFSKEYPTNVQISKWESKLKKDSTILFNQIRTIDKSRIIKKLSCLNDTIMKKVDLAIEISLNLS